MSGSASDCTAGQPLRITFTPSIAEHLRATSEMRRVGRLFDPAAALPLIMGCLLLATLLLQAGLAAGPMGTEALVIPFMPMMFLFGMGIGIRRMSRGTLSFEVTGAGIDVRQPRHRWSLGWERIHRVEETDDFFLVGAEGVAFYLPKRALDEDGGVAALRTALASRGG